MNMYYREGIVDREQNRHYYLTFFPARYILAFLDYFTNESQADKEICKALVQFVNKEAKLLPPEKSDLKFSRKNHSEVLFEIGKTLKNIFVNTTPIQLRPMETESILVPSDIVHRGRLFVAACDDKLLIPNAIMSIYANRGFFPEPWQVLICKQFTTMEELSTFIKRCFLAADNGYKDSLFCIANLEVLDIELQYNLVNHIRSLSVKHTDYLLALICCRVAGVHNHILDQFSSEVVITHGLCDETMKDIYCQLCQNVKRVSSDLSGQGKSEWIKQNNRDSAHKILRSFLIGDGLNLSKLVHQLKKHQLSKEESLHINIVSANNSNESCDINMFLFELLTLGFVFSYEDVVCLPQTTVYIEVSSTKDQKLLNSLPITNYLPQTHLSWDINKLIVSNDIRSPIQIVCRHLNALEQGTIDENDTLFSEERCRELICKYLFEQNIENISSFRFVKIFVNILANQLVRTFI